MACVVRNIGVVFSSEIVCKILEFAFIVYAANHLGAVGFGVLSAALAFTALFSFLTDMGLYQLAVREIARDSGGASSLMRDVFSLKIVLNVLIYTVMCLFALFLGYPLDVVALIAVIGVSMVFESFNHSFNSLFQAFERLEYSSLGRIVSSLILVLSGLSLAGAGWGITGFALAFVLARGGNLLYVFLAARGRFFRFGLRISPGRWRDLLLISWPFGLTLVFTNIFLSSDIVMINYYLGDYDTGVYSAASKIALALTFILAPFNQAIYPRLSAISRDVRGFNLMSGFYLSMMLAIGAPMLVLAALMAGDILGMFYSSQYGMSAAVFPIIVLSVFIAFLSSPFHRVLDATGGQKLVFRAILAGTLVNLFLNFWLIPHYGIIVAAASTVAGQTLFLIVPALECNRIGRWPHVGARSFAGALVGCAILYGTLNYALHLPPHYRMGLACAAYMISYAGITGLGDLRRALGQ
jgi:O-antigen/teichoic acid export membrane protein